MASKLKVTLGTGQVKKLTGQDECTMVAEAVRHGHVFADPHQLRSFLDGQYALPEAILEKIKAARRALIYQAPERRRVATGDNWLQTPAQVAA